MRRFAASLVMVFVGVLLLIPTCAADAPISGLQTVEAGGRKMAISCTGDQGPTVILEAGYGQGIGSWSRVQARVSGFARVCAYDRAGLGGSDPRGGAQATAEDVVSDLHDLLDGAGVDPPYVMAGHSLGGLFVRLFAATYPDEVDGLVLVDPSDEDQSATEAPPDEAGVTIDLKGLVESLHSMPSLGELPLILLHRGQHVESEDVERQWLQQHQRQVRLSANSVLVQADHSGHFIQLDQPDAVIEAIRRVVQAVRTESPLPPCGEAAPH